MIIIFGEKIFYFLDGFNMDPIDQVGSFRKVWENSDATLRDHQVSKEEYNIIATVCLQHSALILAVSNVRLESKFDYC